MGQAKKAWMEDESRGYKLPKENEKFLCTNHFNDKYLNQFIQVNSKSRKCSYCNKKTSVIDLRDFIDYTAEKIISYFGDPQNESLYLGSSFYDDDKEVILGYKRVGPFIAPDTAEEFESTKDLLYEIHLITGNEELDEDIESCFLSDEWIQRDSFILSKRQELSYMWQSFERMVKYKQRFTFFKRDEFTGEKLSDDNGLEDILSELGTIISTHRLYEKIKAGQELYRCRFVDEKEKVDSFDKMTSAPNDRAKQSRMSPAGISMFYGAFEEKTAINESQPADKKKQNRQVVGSFTTTKELKVLDLTELPVQSFWNTLDWEGVDFLHSFCNQITKQIKRDELIHIEYIPTQIFTEYLRYIYKTDDGGKLDGIIYKSSIVGATKNLVLFYDQSSSADILELRVINETPLSGSIM